VFTVAIVVAGHVTGNNLTSNTLTVTVDVKKIYRMGRELKSVHAELRHGFVTNIEEQPLTWLTKSFHALPLTVQ